MRSEKEMFQQILDFARDDDRVRAVFLEGSRSNDKVPKDSFRDYDISFLVTEVAPFLVEDAWLKAFGNIAMMQKPAELNFIPAETSWYAYLMLFDDKIKMDLKLVPQEDLQAYLQHDKLLSLLLDKDSLVTSPPQPSDEEYWLRQPSADFFDDCCNEFWWTSSYVARGLCREELLYATHHMEQYVRTQLLTMLSWEIGSEHGFNFSLGKNYKFMQKYLSQKHWDCLLKTYRMDSIDACWQALAFAHLLFREAAKNVAQKFDFHYPDYDAAVTNYIKNLGFK